jgi:hypothetical protein
MDFVEYCFSLLFLNLKKQKKVTCAQLTVWVSFSEMCAIELLHRFCKSCVVIRHSFLLFLFCVKMHKVNIGLGLSGGGGGRLKTERKRKTRQLARLELKKCHVFMASL